MLRRKEKMNKQELLNKLTSKENFIKRHYGELAEEWKNETDDRGLFSKMYYEMLQALEQLKELNECSEYLYFEVIMPKINEDKKTLQEIKNYFLYERVNTDEE